MTFEKVGKSRLHRTMVASDLDRTLIYSPSALQLPTTDEEAPNLVSVEVLEGPHLNPNANHRELWLRDPDGYVVVLASAYGDV